METEAAKPSSPAVGSAHARRCGYVPDFGRNRMIVECACGFKQSFYLWSWAGHGKAKCGHCKKWICYRTLQVFDRPEELEWWRKLNPQNGGLERNPGGRRKKR